MQLTNLETLKQHYWLKSQLIDYCKKNGLSMVGSKKEIERRIENFLSSGSKVRLNRNKQTAQRDSAKPLTRDSLVVHYKNDAVTRLFFVEHIGKHFHFDAYLRQFTNQKNITKHLTYGDLIEGWKKEELRRNDPNHQTSIGEQFQYNQFTRDYFANEKGKSRVDVTKAWAVAKTLPGAKTYANYVKFRRGDDN